MQIHRATAPFVLRALTVLAALTVTAAAAPTFANSANKIASLTISPVHLADSMLELTGEWNYQKDASLAGIVGVGAPDVEGLTGEALALGIQYRYYPMTTFTGLHVLAELYYVQLDAKGKHNGVNVDVSSMAFSMSAGAGYKYIFDFGLTGEVQIGYGYTVAQGSGTGSAGGQTVNSFRSKEGTGMLVNLNAGWTF